jgi:hypothetical protein
MSAAIDISNPDKPKRVAIVASNPSVFKQTEWAVGFWWAELTHPYLEFVEHGYKVDFCSPDGGCTLRKSNHGSAAVFGNGGCATGDLRVSSVAIHWS